MFTSVSDNAKSRCKQKVLARGRATQSQVLKLSQSHNHNPNLNKNKITKYNQLQNNTTMSWVYSHLRCLEIQDGIPPSTETETPSPTETTSHTRAQRQHLPIVSRDKK